MGWGISDKASNKEKFKSSINDELQGLNSCGDLSYSTYSLLFDILMYMADQIYELGKSKNSEQYNKLIQQTKPLLTEKLSDEEFYERTYEEIYEELCRVILSNFEKLYNLGSLEK